MNPIRMTVATLATVLCLAGSVFAGKYNKVLSIGDAMPTFDDLPLATGGTLSSSALDASYVVLVSLANHCPWVQGGDPDLVETVGELKEQDVAVVGFSVSNRDGDRLPDMTSHAEEFGYNFPYVHDSSQKLGRELGATRTPEFFIFNKERKLIYAGLLHDSPVKVDGDGGRKYINGDPTVNYVVEAISAAKAGNAPDPAETRAHGCSVKYD